MGTHSSIEHPWRQSPEQAPLPLQLPAAENKGEELGWQPAVRLVEGRPEGRQAPETPAPQPTHRGHACGLGPAGHQPALLEGLGHCLLDLPLRLGQ